MSLSDKSPKLPLRSYSEVACVGTGFSGINVGASLKRWYRVTDVQFFDRASGPAGTWTNNSYPGAACDVPGILYSLSYELEPRWKRLIVRQPELRDYLNDVADKYDLTRRMHFLTEVETCIWNERSETWTLHLHNLTTGDKWSHQCRILFICGGGLVQPAPFDVPGVDSFHGSIMHTGRWDPSVQLKGKRVAVVGNGCSAVQIIPALVNEVGVGSVVQFIRSAHWIFPPFDRPLSRRVRFAFAYVPFLMRYFRFLIYNAAEKHGRFLHATDDAAKLRREIEGRCREYIEKTAPAEYVDKLIPPWEVGCRRRIYDSGYVKTLHDPKVKLTDSPIRAIVPDGVLTDDGIEEVDVIALATGFQMKSPLLPIKIIGRDGVELHKAWEQQGGAGAYSTVACAGFPNMMLVSGPNTATGHTSVIIASENSANLALRVLKPVFDGRASTVEALKEAEIRWTNEIQAKDKERIWSFGGCTNWYTNNGWNWTLYPYSQAHFWRRCFFPTWSDWVYRDADGQRYNYRGRDRWIRPMVLILLVALMFIWYLRS